MQVLHRTEATATGRRTPSANTADGAFAVKLTPPKDRRGPVGEGNNPEQLFASGYSACFLGAIQVAAGKQKVKVSDDSTVTAKVGIGPRDDGKGFGLDVELVISLPGLERDVAQAVVDDRKSTRLNSSH